MTYMIQMGETQKRLFILDLRHLVLDRRAFKSSADTYYGSEWKLKPEIEEWFVEQNISFSWKSGYGASNLYLDSDRDAMLFKLTWM